MLFALLASLSASPTSPPGSAATQPAAMPWWGTLIISAIIPCVVAGVTIWQNHSARSDDREERKNEREKDQLQRENAAKAEQEQRQRDRDLVALDALDVAVDSLVNYTGKVSAIVYQQRHHPDDVDPQAPQTLDLHTRAQETTRREASKLEKSHPGISEKSSALIALSDGVRFRDPDVSGDAWG